MTVTPPLSYCDHGYCETEHCRTCEILGVCKACSRPYSTRDVTETVAGWQKPDQEVPDSVLRFNRRCDLALLLSLRDRCDSEASRPRALGSRRDLRDRQEPAGLEVSRRPVRGRHRFLLGDVGLVEATRLRSTTLRGRASGSAVGSGRGRRVGSTSLRTVGMPLPC